MQDVQWMRLPLLTPPSRPHQLAARGAHDLVTAYRVQRSRRPYPNICFQATCVLLLPLPLQGWQALQCWVQDGDQGACEPGQGWVLQGTTSCSATCHLAHFNHGSALQRIPGQLGTPSREGDWGRGQLHLWGENTLPQMLQLPASWPQCLLKLVPHIRCHALLS